MWNNINVPTKALYQRQPCACKFRIWIENKYALESVCIEETIYWTELANQTQNTIYYVVSNIHLA